MDKRTRARELALQAIYQLDVQGDGILGQLVDFFVENESDCGIRQVAAEWAKGTWGNLGQCDEVISASTIKWGLDRLCPVDKGILRLSVYQLIFCPDIPPKVVINEAIELARKFSTAQSPGFVNGVLDAALKKVMNESAK